jgi:hypothetical protein
MTRIFCLILLACMAGAAGNLSAQNLAPEYEGILHNDSDAHRASIEANGKVYWLDFQGADLYHVAERYDRDRVIVRGSVGFPTAESRPVIYVDSITFRSRGRDVTYNVAPQALPREDRRIQTEYRRPAVRERTIIREYKQY